MFRRSVTVLCVSLGLMAVACGGGGSAQPPATGGALSGTLSVVGWQWTAAPGLWPALQAFTTANPNVVLKQVDVPFPSYYDTVALQLGAHQGPDVVIMPDNLKPRLLKSNLLTPLDAPPSGTSLVPPNQGLAADGKRYAYIWNAVGYALIYNKALFQQAGLQPPTTVPDLIADAVKLTNKSTGVYGFGFRQTIAQSAGWWYDLSNWCYGLGGRWSDKTGKPTINEQANVDCVKAYKQMYDSGAVPVGATSAVYNNMFYQGKLAMFIDNGVNPSVPTLGAANLGTAPAPFPSGHVVGITDWVGINRYSSNPRVAQAFVKFLISNDTQSKLLVAFTGGSAVATGKPSQSMIAAQPWAPSFTDISNDYPIMPTGLEALTSQIETIVLGEVSQVLLQNADPKQALDAAQQQVQQLVASSS